MACDSRICRAPWRRVARVGAGRRLGIVDAKPEMVKGAGTRAMGCQRATVSA